MSDKSKIEFRESELRFVADPTGYAGPGRVEGVMLPLGRVASDRQEIFVAGGVRFPAGGVRLLRGHRGDEVLRFSPIESETEVRINAILPDTELGRTLAAEIRDGSRAALSIEFVSLEERSTSGVREITSAFVDAAAAVRAGSYDQARAELRHKRRRHRWR